MAITAADLPRLVTPKQAAQYLGLTEAQVRGLVNSNRIARTPIGARIMIPRDALDQFILDNTVQPCRDEIPVRASGSSKSASATTSCGPKVDAAASAQRALQIANSLKAPSPPSSTSARATPARVIPLRSS
ncbi:MAG: DNA-binding protein [Rhodopseudomonas palustris]|nr:MAG: DNA-binding protein [Rhodopseudomonas palustris]